MTPDRLDCGMRPLLSILLLLTLFASPGLAAPGIVSPISPGTPAPSDSPGDNLVSVTALSDRIAVGEIGQLFVKVRNSNATMPDRIEAQGLEVLFSGEQTSAQIVNGVQSMETTYFYRFQGNKPGVYTIPEFEIHVVDHTGQHTAKTRALNITVTEGESPPDGGGDDSKPIFAKLELSRTSFYVNEIVPFTLTAFVTGRNSIHDVVSAKLEKESFVIKGFRELRTDGTTVGSHYYTFATMPSYLFALKAGTEKLGPGEVALRVVDSSSGFGFSSLFQRTVTQEVKAPFVEVTVKALPAPSPVSFTGGVGNFQMTGTPSTTTLGIGDPVSMEFEVTGVGNLRTMGAPIFAIPQKGIWKTYEANKKLDDENDSDGFKSGRVRFSQVILPEARVNEIPEFQLSFFDPQQEKYVTLKAGPFPITMTASTAPTPAGGVRSESPASAASLNSPPTKPEVAFQDILYIRTAPPVWMAAGDLTRSSKMFWGVQVLLSVLFSTLLGVALVRKMKVWVRRRVEGKKQTSFANLLKRLRGRSLSRQNFYRTANEALSAWRVEHPDAGLEEKSIADALTQRCEVALYSSGSDTQRPLPSDELRDFIAQLSRLSRR